MATVNYTIEASLPNGYLKVEWPLMANGDDGQPFDCSGLELIAMQAWGSEAVQMDGSIEISPSNFALIVGINGFVNPHTSLYDGPVFFTSIRPRVNTGVGAGSGFTLLFKSIR